MVANKLRSIAQQLEDLAKTIDEKQIGTGETNIQLYDVVCAVGTAKARIEILLEHLDFEQ